ncbi:MAG: magnesium protoporphyrin IX methyltransferase, partial [Myxococcales bacterium]|nr:magnesium protoporphyrin IX methyltransferase [Myxococcales bacterium]
EDLTGCRLLDAGCGTGALAVEAARRGADVVAIDLSPTLVGLAESRAAETPVRGSLTFKVGDMLDPSMGRFDFVVAMDSLIHYRAPDMVEMVSRLAASADQKVLFTFAPRTPLLTLMHLVGRLLPHRDRAPMLEPVSLGGLRRRITAAQTLSGWAPEASQRVQSGFYISQALEVVRR